MWIKSPVNVNIKKLTELYFVTEMWLLCINKKYIKTFRNYYIYWNYKKNTLHHATKKKINSVCHVCGNKSTGMTCCSLNLDDSSVKFFIVLGLSALHEIYIIWFNCLQPVSISITLGAVKINTFKENNDNKINQQYF